MNPLEKLVFIALVNKSIIDNSDRHKQLNESIIPIPNNIEVENFPTKKDTVLYDNREMAGIVGLYLILRKEGYKIVYSNEIGVSIKGIDCIAVKDNIWYICEAKGTTTNKKILSYFLRNTKTKGRQMSWDWIWRSLIEFAEDSLNSKVFLCLYRNVIYQKNIRRLIGVSYLKKTNKHFIIESTSLYCDKDINNLKGINLFTNKNNLQKWLNSLDINLIKDKLSFIIKNELRHNV